MILLTFGQKGQTFKLGIIFFCCIITSAQAKEFWVWDLSVMPPTFRRIEAVEKAQGAHSILYVEKNLENNLLTPENIQNIFEQLETHIVPKEEEIFALLPKVINPD